jgi:ribonuclease HI
MKNTIDIYVDGSVKGNPGRGGYGAIINKYRDTVVELSGGYKKTTNNRMELLAVIKALETILAGGPKITVYSDSQYVVKSVMYGWVFGWEKDQFFGRSNSDLWKEYLVHHRRLGKVTFVWVRGHNGHPENERCDELAGLAADGNDLKIDFGYDNGF